MDALTLEFFADEMAKIAGNADRVLKAGLTTFKTPAAQHFAKKTDVLRETGKNVNEAIKKSTPNHYAIAGLKDDGAAARNSLPTKGKGYTPRTPTSAKLDALREKHYGSSFVAGSEHPQPGIVTSTRHVEQKGPNNFQQAVARRKSGQIARGDAQAQRMRDYQPSYHSSAPTPAARPAQKPPKVGVDGYLYDEQHNRVGRDNYIPHFYPK